MIGRSKSTTHADDCWSWGPGHYDCAVDEIERLRELLQSAFQRGYQSGARGLREVYDAVQEVKSQDAWDNTRLTEALMEAEERAERAEAENKQLREQLRLATIDQAIAEAEANDAHAENKRLREALEDIRSLSFINSAMRPNPLTLTALLGDIHQIADAALSKENKA